MQQKIMRVSVRRNSKSKIKDCVIDSMEDTEIHGCFILFKETLKWISAPRPDLGTVI